jgi:hypothetical protein
MQLDFTALSLTEERERGRADKEEEEEEVVCPCEIIGRYGDRHLKWQIRKI